MYMLYGGNDPDALPFKRRVMLAPLGPAGQPVTGEGSKPTGVPDGGDASANITARIEALGDGRVETLAHVRQLIHDANPQIQEVWKWAKPTSGGIPVWSHDGIVCSDESYEDKVKFPFARGASLSDPKKVFNASLEGGTRRAIDLREGEKINATAFKQLIHGAMAPTPPRSPNGPT
jgi:hypothetical protein